MFNRKFRLLFIVYLGKVYRKLRRETAKCTDERIQTMNEIVPAMRVIKMYAWEKVFAKLVDLYRRSIIKNVQIRNR